MSALNNMHDGFGHHYKWLSPGIWDAKVTHSPKGYLHKSANIIPKHATGKHFREEILNRQRGI